MVVVLTSFRDSQNWEGPKFSVARWQPRNFDYPELSFLAPWDPDTGRKMVHLEPDVFREKYERVLDRQQGAIIDFYASQVALPGVDQIVLCCWCHPQRQQGYEKLYCHSILVGYWLERELGLEIVMADGREKPLWERH